VKANPGLALDGTGKSSGNLNENYFFYFLGSLENERREVIHKIFIGQSCAIFDLALG